MRLSLAARSAEQPAARPATDADPIADLWYLALPGHRLRRGQTLGMQLLGRPVVIGRDRAGAVFSLNDRCPHRGARLSLGWMLAARFVWGLAAGGPRVVTMAIVRDRYEGDQMARVMSVVMAMFMPDTFCHFRASSVDRLQSSAVL